MIADCGITCGSYGQGFVALDRLVGMLPEILVAVLFIGAIWFISEVRK